jgi:hypothetical protein
VSPLGPEDELLALPSAGLAALVSPEEAALLGHAFHGATLAALRNTYLGAGGPAAAEVGGRQDSGRWCRRHSPPQRLVQVAALRRPCPLTPSPCSNVLAPGRCALTSTPRSCGPPLAGRRRRRRGSSAGHPRRGRGRPTRAPGQRGGHDYRARGSKGSGAPQPALPAAPGRRRPAGTRVSDRPGAVDAAPGGCVLLLFLSFIRQPLFRVGARAALCCPGPCGHPTSSSMALCLQPPTGPRCTPAHPP